MLRHRITQRCSNIHRNVFRRLISSSIEIERKFQCTSTALEYCTLNSEKFLDIEMQDIYYDNQSFDLTKSDMWLRARNNSIELKWPRIEALLDGCDGTDFYNESTDQDKISSLLKQRLQLAVSFNSSDVADIENCLRKFGVEEFGAFVTYRRRYFVSVPISPSIFGNFDNPPDFQRVFIDIDNVHFRPTPMPLCVHPSQLLYSIGEIEFENITGDFDINTMMRVMKEVFRVVGIEPAPVRGKVLEYLHRFRPEHYAALLESGQLASKGLA